jgi:hypothetical protein
MEELFDKLRNDKDLFYSYQCNIAMSFYDAFVAKLGEDRLTSYELAEVSNTAAVNFLNLLISK